ncbi:hypothetical protein AAMO2058_000557500 [Amorphochlora amoebiformis]
MPRLPLYSFSKPKRFLKPNGHLNPSMMAQSVVLAVYLAIGVASTQIEGSSRHIIDHEAVGFESRLSLDEFSGFFVPAKLVGREDIQGSGEHVMVEVGAGASREKNSSSRLAGRLFQFSIQFEGGQDLDRNNVASDSSGESRRKLAITLKNTISSAAMVDPAEVAVRNFQSLNSGGFLVDVEIWMRPSEAPAAGSFEQLLRRRPSGLFAKAPDLTSPAQLYGRPTLSGIESHAVSQQLVERRDALRLHKLRIINLEGFRGNPGASSIREVRGGTLVPRVAHANPDRGQHWATLPVPGKIGVRSKNDAGGSKTIVEEPLA